MLESPEWPSYRRSLYLGESIYRSATSSAQVPKVVFFDNEEKNFLGKHQLLPNVKCVKVEGDEKRESLSDFSVLVENEGEEEVKKHMNAIIGVCRNSGFEMYDKDSGIKEGNFEGMTPDQVLVFDWDLTLTMIEGFLFKTDDWKLYLCGLESHGGVKTDGLMESHMKAMFGGSVRFNMIKENLRQWSVDNVYILTNNRRKDLIYKMAIILMPNFKPEHVISMHHVTTHLFSSSLSPKLNYLKNNIPFKATTDARERWWT